MYAFSKLLAPICLFTFCLSSHEVIVRTPSGESLTFDVDPQMPFQEVVGHIENYVKQENASLIENQESFALDQCMAVAQEENSSSKGWLMEFMLGATAATTTKAQTSFRDYWQNVTVKEKADLKYIVTTLATGSWTKIISESRSLKKAGERLDHLHPLRFAMAIFSDEELKAGAHAIRETGGKIWREFFGGLEKSLTRESKNNNIKPEHIQHFTATLNLKGNAIPDSLQNKRWEEFVKHLMQQLPRGGNPGRYDQ
jgi:hypothetical protein